LTTVQNNHFTENLQDSQIILYIQLVSIPSTQNIYEYW